VEYLDFKGLAPSLAESFEKSFPVSTTTASDLMQRLKEYVEERRLPAIAVKLWQKLNKVESRTTLVWFVENLTAVNTQRDGKTLLAEESQLLTKLPEDFQLREAVHPLDGKVRLHATTSL
jgi:hypothetical protein